MEEEEEGKQLLLSSRVSPTVPPIGEVAPGWQAIDSLGAWDSFLCKFPVLQEVPEQYKGDWDSFLCKFPLLQEVPGKGPWGRCWPGGSRQSQSWRPPGPSWGWASSPRLCSGGGQEGGGQELPLRQPERLGKPNLVLAEGLGALCQVHREEAGEED